MTKTKAATAATSAIGNWPLSEDRKPAVVRTDVARGLLTEEQARDASRGLGHPDTRVDTPAESDPLVGNLAGDAAQAKADAGELDHNIAADPLDPQKSGEAAARLLDEEVRDNLEARDKRLETARKERDKDGQGTGEVITAQDKLDEQGDSFEAPERPDPVGNQ